MYSTTRIRDDFHFLQYSGNAWPTAANAWLVVDSDGLILIDAGLNEPSCFAGLERCIAAAGFETADVHTIVLTHGHTDHVAGVNRILNQHQPRLLLAEECISEATDPAAQEEAVLPQAVRDIVPELGDYDLLGNFRDTCGDWLLRDVAFTQIRDGDEITLGQYRFEAIHVPGHDIGLMVFLERSLNLMLTTDLFRTTGPGAALPWYSSAGGGVGPYLASLDRLAPFDGNIDIALPSHGGPIDDFATARILTKTVIEDREEQIVAMLADGPKRCTDLDQALYSANLLTLCPWYASATEAHLVRLEADQRIVRDGDIFAFAG